MYNEFLIRQRSIMHKRKKSKESRRVNLKAYVTQPENVGEYQTQLINN